MFHSSTQRSYWIFSDSNELKKLREKANADYITRMKLDKAQCLTSDEERVLVYHYEHSIKQFCGRFQPAITMTAVVGTSIAYFKRFYLNNSVMDYHPRDIHLVCIYLAMKIEEFNVSISQFIENIDSNGDNEEDLKSMITNLELLLIEKLFFHLTIHNFYRPFEGFILDIKARCPEIKNSDILRQSAFEFLDKILNTDAILLFPPSQIALTALVYSSSKNKIDHIDSYCQSILLNELNTSQVKHMLTIIKSINRLHKDIPSTNLKEKEILEEKLMKCYNQENDPRSQSFKERMRKYLEDEDNESFL